MESPWDLAIQGKDYTKPRPLSDVNAQVDKDGHVKFSLGAPGTPNTKLEMTRSKKKSAYAGEWVGVNGDGSAQGRSADGNGDEDVSSGYSKRQRSLSWECNYLESSPKDGESPTSSQNSASAKVPHDSQKATPTPESPKTQGRRKRSALKNIFSRALSIEESPSEAKAAANKKNASKKKSRKQQTQHQDPSNKPKVKPAVAAIADITSGFKLTPGATAKEDAVTATIRAWSASSEEQKTQATTKASAGTTIEVHDNDSAEARGPPASKKIKKHKKDRRANSKTAKSKASADAQNNSAGKSPKETAVVASTPQTKAEKLTAMEKKARKKAKRTQKAVRRALLMFQAAALVLDPAFRRDVEAGKKAADKKPSKQPPLTANRTRTILSFDVEAYESDHEKILEVGCVLYTFVVGKVCDGLGRCK